MPRVTRLSGLVGGRVRVELDGEPWRTLPLEAVARAGLTEGLELDRFRLRVLARDLRRRRALDVAGRALSRRDLSDHDVRKRLRRAGVSSTEEEEALAALRDVGLVDDARFARRRAEALAARGRGDAAVRYDLEQHGVRPDEIAEALSLLEPEHERAARIVERRGAGPSTARFLAGRGFDEEAVRAALGAAVALEP